jgi:hypothetical protein
MKPTVAQKNSCVFALLCLFALTGCTHIIRPPDEPFSGYTQQEKIRLRIGLNITDELRQAKTEWHRQGDTWIMPVGVSIAQNAETLAQHVFENVVKVQGPTERQTHDVDAVLTPRLAYANRTLGVSSFGDSIIAIKVEWNLTTPDGKAIWVDTVGGEARGSSGWTKPETILKQALENLWRNSQQAMVSSDAIKRFVPAR